MDIAAELKRLNRLIECANERSDHRANNFSDFHEIDSAANKIGQYISEKLPDSVDIKARYPLTCPSHPSCAAVVGKMVAWMRIKGLVVTA